MRSARAAGLRVALRGPSGCGKTALTEAAFADCVTVSCTEATEVDDFYGRLLPGEVPGTFDWEDGPLTIAASTGGVLLVDDAGWLSPGVQAVLLDVLDGRTQFTAALRPAHCGGRTVRIEPGFTVVLAWNPGQGRIIDPLLSRFALPVDCSTNFTLARALGVPADFVKLAERLDKERVNPAKELRWSPQMRDLLHAAAIAKTFGRSTGARALVGKAPEQFRGRVASEAADVLRIANLGSLETGPLEAAAV
jgi:MoxR-like ATPase